MPQRLDESRRPRFPAPRRRRGREVSYAAAAALLAALLLAAPCRPALAQTTTSAPATTAPAPAGERLLEGFEALEGIRVAGGKLHAVRENEGVTQGAQAAELPAGVQISVLLEGVKPAATPWLKLDTLTTQPLVHRLRLRMQGLRREIVAHVRPGKDTLWIPLTTVAGDMRGGWGEKVDFSVANGADSSITIDNLRLAPAAAPPGDCVLLDFGREDGYVWPGFTIATAECKHIAWSGNGMVYAGTRDNADPLTGDWIAPALTDHSGEKFAIAAPGGASGVAWLWVTHYGYRGFQPVEYSVQFRDRPVLQKKQTAKQMLGPAGLFMGMGGAWTSEWFASQFAPGFYECVQLPLSNTGNLVELSNCQPTALAMGPSARRTALAAYVKQVEEELVRFRRQFLAAYASHDLCDLEPREAEAKAGLMLFAPPPDHAFQTGWSPADADRTKGLRAVAVAGGMVVVPLAAAPVKACDNLTVAVGSLGGSGGALAVDRAGAAAWLLERVPVVRDGRIAFQPWVLTRRLEKLRPMEIAHAAIVIPVSAAAAGGKYKGSVRLTSPTASAELPLELEVVPLPARLDEPPTFLPEDHVSAGSYYHATASLLAEPQAKQLHAKIRQQLLEDAVNSLMLSGPGLGAHGENAMVDDLQLTPVRLLAGPVVLDIRHSFGTLSLQAILPGTMKYRSSVSTIVSKASAVAAKSGLKDHLLLVGRAMIADGIAGELRKAEAVSAAGGRAALLVTPGALKGMAGDGMAKMKPFHALILWEGGGADKCAESFKALGEGRKVFLMSGMPDRYACGFRAAALKVDGVCVGGIGLESEPYAGRPNGSGMLIPRPDGTFVPTLAMLRLQQARDDFALLRRAEKLAAAGAAKPAGSPEKTRSDALQAEVQAVRTKAAATDPGGFDRDLMRSTAAGPAQIEAWRDAIFKALRTGAVVP